MIGDLVFGYEYSQILGGSGEVEVSGGVAQTDDFGFDDIVGSETVQHDNLVNEFLADVLFAYGGFDVFSEGGIFELNEIHEGLLFSYFSDFCVDCIAYSDVDTSDGEMVDDLKGVVLIFVEKTQDGSEDVLIIDVESFEEMLAIIFSDFLSDVNFLVDVIVHD